MKIPSIEMRWSKGGNVIAHKHVSRLRVSPSPLADLHITMNGDNTDAASVKGSLVEFRVDGGQWHSVYVDNKHSDLFLVKVLQMLSRVKGAMIRAGVQQIHIPGHIEESKRAGAIVTI